VRKFRLYKPPRRFAPCRLDFDTQLSSIATLPLSLPFRHHSWLPSIQIFLTLPWLPIVPYTSFLPPSSPSPFFPPSPPSSSFFLTPHFSYMPIIRPRRHDVIIIHAYTATTHDAIITVSSCYVIAAGAPISC